MMVSDASTAVFTVDAGGIKKAVSIYALGLEVEGMPDAPARAAFKNLADRLADFDNGGATPTEVYAPERYRGILMDGAAAPDQKPWPWADIKPKDFPFPADPNAFQMAQRALTAADGRETRLRPVPGRLPGDDPRRSVRRQDLLAVAATAPPGRARHQGIRPLAPATSCG